MSSKVKVAVRVRPMNRREIELSTKVVVDMDGNQTVLDSERKQRRTFAFDHCFWSMDPAASKFASQEMVFDALGRDILENAFEGYNACIFAYGQTGSGKSYTMMGGGDDSSGKGLIPRICDALFDKIAQSEDKRVSYNVEVSYMEIYNEKVRDLLNPKGGKHTLKVREHKTLGPYVESLSKLAVRSFKDIQDLMSEGNKSRTVAATQMNAESSRSHAVFSIVLTQRLFDLKTQSGNEKVSKLSLVDLAGSERASKSGALGDRLKEGSNINKSLTTLGLVISALADISSGKKPKNAYVPYRDSTLTWLLKDNLGGNSKTVMVATVSPASDNYEETLSTLRYADRAKRIVNHAVVNEDANSKIVRELREEVEKLRKLLMDGVKHPGGGGGDTMGPMREKEIGELKERLRISESLMGDLSRTWEQRLADTEKIHVERQKALADMGISVQAAGIGVQTDKYYLVNLNADPTMNELLVCYLKEITRIGRPDAKNPQDIQLRGLGIASEHCILEIVENNVFLTPQPNAKSRINGRLVAERTMVRHGYRILLGNNHLFRLSCPRGAGQVVEDDNEAPVEYEQAMREISINELTDDPFYAQMQEQLQKKHQTEKGEALDAQKEMYEKQLSVLREQLEESAVNKQSLPSPPNTLEEEWEDQNRERLMNTVLLANQLVREANMLSEALHRDTMFRVTLTIPKSFLSPQLQHSSEEMHTSNEIAIRVIHRQRGTDSVWSLNTLAEKVLTMRDMYQCIEEGGYGPVLDDSIGPDPFFDLEQHALLGVANIFLECLFHGVLHEYDAPIIGPTGKVCGKLRLGLQSLPASAIDQNAIEDVDASATWEAPEEIEELRPGTKLAVQVSVLEASGLPLAYSHNLFCQYKFWGQEDSLIIPPLIPPTGQEPSTRDNIHRFNHTQMFGVEATEEFLEYVDEGALAVEVWGHRRSVLDSAGGGLEDDTKQRRSLADRWNEVIKRLEVWVDIMELNDQGEYVPVEVQSKADPKTGGTYLIKQGQSRRILVKVVSVPGAGNSPLVLDSITSVSVGSIYLRNRYDQPLDSYQELDLERLRAKWSEALDNRREYLDAEVRKIMEKVEKTSADTQRENELIDQWTMLQWERMAVVQPKAGSGVPGAPANWQLRPGMEVRVPVVFLDLNNDDEEEDVVGEMVTGELFGEKPETMMRLPILQHEEYQATISAVASWDSTIHDTTSLNKVTGSNDRVYAILKIKVMLKHPHGVELTLRKRISLKVYKRIGFGASIMKAFQREYQSSCGVMVEVVSGIPKSEGMQPPPKIPANPSFVELKEDENAVEKFKKGMASIATIISLDRLKQEVALKEKLAQTGKALKKKYVVQPNELATPQSLSRADSGIVFNSSRPHTPDPEDHPLATGSTQPSSSDNSIPQEKVEFVITPPEEIKDSIAKKEEEEEEEMLKTVSPVMETIHEEEHEEAALKKNEIENKTPDVPKEEEEVSAVEDGKEEVNSVENCAELSSDVKEEPSVSNGSIVQPEETKKAGEEDSEPVTTSAAPEDSSPTEEEVKQEVKQEDEEAKVEVQVNDVNQVQSENTESVAAVEIEKPCSPPSTSSSPNPHPVSPDPQSEGGAHQREPSPSPSGSSEGSEAALAKSQIAEFKVGEKVMVEMSSTFKIGIIKFVGETKFAPGEWVGVALDRPLGKHNGTVKDQEYFKCKEKHGLFVRPDKIIRYDKVSTSSPSHSPSPSPRGPPSTGPGRLRHTSTSPSSRRHTPPTHSSSSRSLLSARRSSGGGRF